MGNCAASSNVFSVLPSHQNNFVHLLMLNQTDIIINKINIQKFPINQSINFRNDTILHYACAKQNYQLINFLLSHKQIIICQKNIMGQMPKDLTKNQKIKKMLS